MALPTTAVPRIRGTGPPPPLGDHPNGIDISHPSYAIDSVNWHEPPKQFAKEFITPVTMTLRANNGLAYKTVGNPTTWNRYIAFGYHSYDHCFQFDTQWERIKTIATDALQFIWESYSYVKDREWKFRRSLRDGRWTLLNLTSNSIAKNPHGRHHRSTPRSQSV